MNKLSLINLIKEESGEKGFAELILRNLVKTGEKTLPKEVGRYEVNGVKMVLKAESYTYLMTKSALSNEERQIIRQINRNIVNVLGEDIFVVAIKEATRGLDRIGTKTVETKILNNYFDGETIARIENKLRPNNLGSVQVPAVIETRLNREISNLPEGGALFNPEMPNVSEVSMDNAITIIREKAKQNGLNLSDDQIKKLIESNIKLINENSNFKKILNDQSENINKLVDVVKKQLSGETPLPKNTSSYGVKRPPFVNNKFLKNIKGFLSDKIGGLNSIKNANLLLSAIQIASIYVEVKGSDKDFRDWEQGLTGWDAWQVVGYKIATLYFGNLLGMNNQLLMYLNTALAGIDVYSMLSSVNKYAPKRKENIKKEKEIDAKKQAKKDSIEKAGIDFANQKAKFAKDEFDSLVKDKKYRDSIDKVIQQRLNPQNTLDASGKTQITDPFKQ